MCDYSLDYVASRPAVVGDKLVTMRFKNSSTRGFAAITEPNIAVCLLPGTELAFEHDVELLELEPSFGFFGTRQLGQFFGTRKLGQKVARFRQINKGRPHIHHDALEFPGAETVLVTHLRAGQRVTVLQLPVTAGTTSATEEQKSASVPV